MPDEPKPRPKIIVDDDWKTRVQAEKEAAVGPNQTGPTPPASKTPDSDAEPPIPPASFTMLVTTLATQALAALGQIPMGEGEQPVVMLDHAKHFVDSLAILAEKTKGNLTPEESQMLDNVLHELRMVYVAISKRK